MREHTMKRRTRQAPCVRSPRQSALRSDTTLDSRPAPVARHYAPSDTAPRSRAGWRLPRRAGSAARPGRARKRGVDQARLPDRALANQLDHSLGLRVKAIHKRLHQQDAVLARGGIHLGALGGVQRQGLLAQDVLAGLGGLGRPLVV
jgi:hypothetical protein